MWCDFECETCAARDSKCLPPKKDYDLEEINDRNISTSDDFERMCDNLEKERWEK